MLDVICYGESKDYGLQHLAVSTNFTWSFKTSFTHTVIYNCNLKYHGEQCNITVFMDNILFIDDECGGRHCFWKANKTGIYLFNFQKQQSMLIYEWFKNNMNGSSTNMIV